MYHSLHPVKSFHHVTSPQLASYHLLASRRFTSPQHITSHLLLYIASHHIASHRIASHHIASNNITSSHITHHHTASYRSIASHPIKRRSQDIMLISWHHMASYVHINVPRHILITSLLQHIIINTARKGNLHLSL